MNHPITPPPELFRQWAHLPRSLAFEAAYRAGADAELEECCEWLGTATYGDTLGIYTIKDVAVDLRAAPSPQPPSLREAALQALNRFMATDGHEGCTAEDIEDDYYLIRKAVESLSD